MTANEAHNAIDRMVISSRYCGPPDSGNGGYVCGRLAHYADGPVKVRLIRPPPLDTPLEVLDTGAAIELRDAEGLIARASPGDGEVDPRPAPSLDEALARRQHYAGLVRHAFPTCFVCGTRRAEGDGLRIHPGIDPAHARIHQVACDWRPHEDLCDTNGIVQQPYVWAALDCPSGWAFLSFEDTVAVLGELTARILSPLKCGKDYIVAGWEIGRDGRKRFTASALYTPDGKIRATAKATWIVLEAG